MLGWTHRDLQSAPEIMQSLFDFLSVLGAGIEENWLLIFWATLLVCAFVEYRIPAFERPATRRSRWPTNIALGVVVLLLATLSPLTSVLAALWAKSEGIGLLNWLPVPGWLAFIRGFLMRSLASYAFHVMGHKLPLLWRFHRVHHSDTHLDVTTGLRSHPAEFLLLTPFVVAVTLLFGLPPVAIIAYELAEALNALINHSNVRLPDRLDRALRWVLVTPNMHAAHHSAWQPETDSNYGGLISVWDRLFGTYTREPRGGYDGMKIGLEEIEPKRAAAFWWQLWSPLVHPGKSSPDR